MKICGLQKTTLLDFPGHVAATIFTGGCSFRCPFCHNSGLLPSWAPEVYTEEEILSFLKKRRGILEGVCITGGEPSLQPDLEDLIRKIRSLGLLVKLDTNGYRPDLLKDLCRKGLLDYVAMDVKAGQEHYPQAVGTPGLDLALIDESIRFLLTGTVPFEFRTTAVKGLHTKEDFRQIGPWIAGCPHYFIQNFADNGEVLFPETFEPFRREELEEFAGLVRPYVGEVLLRGTD
ncbi:MAG TPA: anaerobic ribonucleoside-triphosphate reductase activating protein [Candidatus Enterocloster faecavium]|uniref:Anaerobic ribonucleoside-triphosphate reductase activating protein n=1 Tax=Candidatus Enterocloster faecavium TaxID=2838560 RepID=A0A9D2L915_9FIRM|nr:anaerobic ribonucleoside-triphosphate reductase activating protein [Candidatus Enterocloster faecavium]